MTFTKFFDKYVLQPTAVKLNKKYEELGKDIDLYRREYYTCLATYEGDGRTKRAIGRELSTLEEFPERQDFTKIGRNQTNKVSADAESAIRVFVHVGDKLDLRVASILEGKQLWNYVGQLLCDGALDLFSEMNMTDDEYAVMQLDSNDEIIVDTQRLILEKLNTQYQMFVMDLYNGIRPELRTGVL